MAVTNTVRLGPEYIPNPTTGRPITNAQIYVGEVDTDPEIPANQKQVSAIQENGSTVEISQPVRTGAGGVPLYNGSPVTITVEGNYSMKVLSSNGVQLYYIPEVTEVVIPPPITDFADTEFGVYDDLTPNKRFRFELSQVSPGTTVLMTAPDGNLDFNNPVLYGTLDTSGNIIKHSKGSDVDSNIALTVPEDGNFFDVTGTNTIESIGTSGVIGTTVKLRFTTVLALTHNATSFILPGAGNITTEVGDIAEFVEFASGNWVCSSYQRASGLPITAPEVDFSVSLLDTFNSTGNHTVNNIVVGKPVFITFTSTATVDSYVQFKMLSGTADGKNDGTNQWYALGHDSSISSSHGWSEMIVPTTDGIIIAVVDISADSEIRVYQ